MVLILSQLLYIFILSHIGNRWLFKIPQRNRLYNHKTVQSPNFEITMKPRIEVICKHTTSRAHNISAIQYQYAWYDIITHDTTSILFSIYRNLPSISLINIFSMKEIDRTINMTMSLYSEVYGAYNVIIELIFGGLRCIQCDHWAYIRRFTVHTMWSLSLYSEVYGAYNVIIELIFGGLRYIQCDHWAYIRRFTVHTMWSMMILY